MFMIFQLALLTHIGVIIFTRVIPVKVVIGFGFKANVASFHLVISRGFVRAQESRKVLEGLGALRVVE